MQINFCHISFIETALQFELKGVVFKTADCKRLSLFLSRSFRFRVLIFDGAEGKPKTA